VRGITFRVKILGRMTENITDRISWHKYIRFEHIERMEEN